MTSNAISSTVLFTTVVTIFKYLDRKQIQIKTKTHVECNVLNPISIGLPVPKCQSVRSCESYRGPQESESQECQSPYQLPQSLTFLVSGSTQNLGFLLRTIFGQLTQTIETNFPSSRYKEQQQAVAKHLLAIWKTRQTSEKTDLR